MGLRDKHDPREQGFRHFAKIAPDGTVLAIVEVVDEPDLITNQARAPENPKDDQGKDLALHVPITDLYPYDFTDIKVSRKHVTEKNHFAIRADLRALNKARG